MTGRWKEIHMCDISEFLCTEDDLRKMYYFFKDLLSNLPPKLTYQEMTAYWEYKKLTRSEVIAKMAAIVWFLDDKKLKDDVIDFIDQRNLVEKNNSDFLFSRLVAEEKMLDAGHTP